MRVSPPELDRLLPGPYISESITRRPVRRKWSAVQAPNTPAPTTTTSKLFIQVTCSCRSGAQTVQHGLRNIQVTVVAGTERDLRFHLAVKVRAARYREIELASEHGIALHV